MFATERGSESASVCVRVSSSQRVCVSEHGAAEQSAPHALLCAVSQSVLSSVEAAAELPCILSWAGPASRGLKGEGCGGGWGHRSHS